MRFVYGLCKEAKGGGVMRTMENSMVRRDVRSWEWDRFDEIVDAYLIADEHIEDYYLDDFGTEADDEAIKW